MKKYILSVLFVVVSISVCNANTDLSKLAGKQIYRDVPVRGKSFFSKEYMNIKYELYSYNDSYIEIKQLEGIEYGKSIILNRSLWDDGKWKLWDDHTMIKNLIGKKIHRTKPCEGDKSYINDLRILLDVKDNDLILSGWNWSEDKETIKLSRSKWDDGNWKEYSTDKFLIYGNVVVGTWKEEKKPERILVRELIGSEAVGLSPSRYISEYHCVECGEKIALVYYCITIYKCNKCKKYFDINKGE